jgi:catechol 2,3-dioxygenase-like lactoylglutathione lyase family enzyme
VKCPFFTSAGFLLPVLLPPHSPINGQKHETERWNPHRKVGRKQGFLHRKMGFGVTFENEFYLLLHTPNRQAEISFLLPNHPTQQPFFHQPFNGKGMYLTIEVDDVDTLYHTLTNKGVEIKVALRDEPWGDRHFAIEDPNGIGIDLVKYSQPAE